MYSIAALVVPKLFRIAEALCVIAADESQPSSLFISIHRPTPNSSGIENK